MSTDRAAEPDATVGSPSRLHNFLFALVGIQPNGMELSVVSVLARSGADPWREAGRLAALPKADAINSLARTIAGMPHSLCNAADAEVISARLVDLLPAPLSAVSTDAVTSVLRRLMPGPARLILISSAVAAGYAIAALLQQIH